mmetsp:Transcript_35033/g.44997  ORF Transcript_35033/g.44997 Transcript_35033/m.44997 type:complete len:344 (-) Transcript_35033:235-1266(-)
MMENIDQKTSGNSLDENDDISLLSKENGSEWIWRQQDDEKLLKCVRKVPPGRPRRWERITDEMNSWDTPRADPNFATGGGAEGEGGPPQGQPERKDNDSDLSHPQFSKEEVLGRLGTMFNRQSEIHVQEEEIAALIKPLNTLFQDHPFSMLQELSQNERRNNHFQAEQLVFGETDLTWFLKTMLLLRKLFGHFTENGGKFWDVGCAGGKLLFAAALCHSFDMCFGFEILQSLYDEARVLHMKYEREVKPTLREAKQRVHFEIQKRDALVVEGGWDEVTFIIIHVCWRDTKILNNIQEKLERMPTGSICISVAKPFVSDNWVRLALSHMPASWGRATVYVWEKQ